MPGYKGHLAGGFIVYGALIFLICHYWMQPSLITAAEWLLFLLAGSLFPDVDVKSKGQHLVYAVLFAVLSILLLHGCYKIVAIVGVASLLPMLVKHRGLFHNPLFLIALPLALALVAAQCMPDYSNAIAADAFFFIIGALVHIALDRGIRGIFG